MSGGRAVSACLGRVYVAGGGQCRAAGRRWRAEVITALQNTGGHGTRHQSKAGPNVNALARKDLPSVVALTEGRLRTEKPNEIKGVALPSVVAVQNTTTRSESASGGWLLVLAPSLAGVGYPPSRYFPAIERCGLFGPLHLSRG